MIEMKGKHSSAKIMIDNVEPECVSMIQNILNHPSCTNPVAIMPDTHLGKGIVIGFTMKLGDKVVPNHIGVDIGCGIRASKIPACYDMEKIDMKTLDKLIRKKVPLGTGINKSPCKKDEIDLICELTNESFKDFLASYCTAEKRPLPEIKHFADYKWFESLCKKIETTTHQVRCSLGSLGGGNHFIEIAKGETDFPLLSVPNNYWLLVHSGSRNFGLKIANYHQNKAKITLENKRKMMEEKIKNEILNDSSNIKERANLIKNLKKKFENDPSVDLRHSEYLEGEDLFEYIFDMFFAQNFAKINRATITLTILQCLAEMTNQAPAQRATIVVDSVHNYIDPQDLIIRKGAIRSYKDEISIIPFNMRDGSLLTEGKSNEEWNCSAPHGAGRVYSRAKAKQTLKLEDFQKEMEGIFSTSVRESTLDEAPMAYKDMSFITEAIEETCEIKNKLKPIYNLKA